MLWRRESSGMVGRRESLMVLLVVLLAALLFGCAQKTPSPQPETKTEVKTEANQPQEITLRFLTGSSSTEGSWYTIAVAMSDVWKREIPEIKDITLEFGGGTASVLGIEAGQGDIAITTSITVGDALVGNPPFTKKATHLSAFAAFTNSFYDVAVWKDSDIKTPQDLKGKRIAPGPKGYTSNTLTELMLNCMGMTWDDVKPVFVGDEAPGLMQDGHLDAYATMAAEKDSALVDLSVSRPIRIVPIPDDLFNKMKEKSPGIIRLHVPAGTYNGVDEQVPTIGGKLVVIANPDLPEELVYKLAKTLSENFEKVQGVSDEMAQVQPEDLGTEFGLKYHPGAAKYYGK